MSMPRRPLTTPCLLLLVTAASCSNGESTSETLETTTPAPGQGGNGTVATENTNGGSQSSESGLGGEQAMGSNGGGAGNSGGNGTVASGGAGVDDSEGLVPPGGGVPPGGAGVAGSAGMAGSGAGGTAVTSGGGGAMAAGGAGAAGSGGMASAGGALAAGAGGTMASGGGGAMENPPVGVDSDGCSLALEGFASVSTEQQDGTYGGRDGETVTVKDQADLERYAGASEPYIIKVDGKVVISPKGTEIQVASNKTFLGVGATGEISQGGFFLGNGVHNVIIRNLKIGDTFVEGDESGKSQDFDAIQMDTAHHVWIDHCHLHHGGDGLIDSRKDTTNLTVSWNVLSDHNKAFGIGWTDNLTAEMTIHHNWLRDLRTRNPSTDNVLRAHLYNNFMQRIGNYGNWARGGTNMVLENSVFEDVKRPHFYDSGTLVARDNIYRSTSGDQESSSEDYSFFTPSDFYQYALDPAENVEALLAQCAGPRATLGL